MKKRNKGKKLSKETRRKGSAIGKRGKDKKPRSKVDILKHEF